MEICKPNTEGRIDLYCTSCARFLGHKDSQKFIRMTYGSNSTIYKAFKRNLVCKDCLKKDYDDTLKSCNNDSKQALYLFCQKHDYPFHIGIYNGSEKTHEATGANIFFEYIKTLNSFSGKNNYADCFLFGDKLNQENISVDTPTEYSRESKKRTKTRMSPQDKQNKKDVINILGYDPFEMEPEQDKKYLYNKLIDFLDDSTLEDNFKIPVVIEITKGFSQVERLNELINQIYESENAIESGKEIKDLITTRTNALGSILSLAKDNGISANHNINKSKGAGTLSGILKDLQSKKFDEAEVNLFDIETCEGMRQVADISHRSISNQLKWDENTYTEMIQEQKKIIKETTEENMIIKEELRLLKIKQKEEA